MYFLHVLSPYLYIDIKYNPIKVYTIHSTAEYCLLIGQKLLINCGTSTNQKPPQSFMDLCADVIYLLKM